MAKRSAEAVWKGNLKNGDGLISLGSGVYEGPYDFTSRFEDGPKTNPEELIAAAHAACFSMALSAMLTVAGYEPKKISSKAYVSIEPVGDGFEITKSDIVMEAEIPNIDEKTFLEIAEKAKAGCPVSKALAGVKISLSANLI